MNINETLENSQAHSVFLSIVENEFHTIKTNYDNGDYQDMLLSESGLYEFTEECDDHIICYIKRIL